MWGRELLLVDYSWIVSCRWLTEADEMESGCRVIKLFVINIHWRGERERQNNCALLKKRRTFIYVLDDENEWYRLNMMW